MNLPKDYNMDCTPLFEKTLEASRSLNLIESSAIDHVLVRLADVIIERSSEILVANAKDLDRMSPTDPKYDRLMLTEERLEGIADDMRHVAKLESPVGHVLSSVDRPNGMKISRVTVPFGVIGIIYEARPNVTFDVFSLCLKSGNACLLKGGSDAYYSNVKGVEIIQAVLNEFSIDQNVIGLLPAGREETTQLLNAHGYVDLIIPRGSQNLIQYVREHATIPVIETGAGICHTYFDEFGDTYKGSAIVTNAKTRRVSVCNALDCLVIHKSRIDDLFEIVAGCIDKNVKIFADLPAFASLEGKYPEQLLTCSTNESYGTEFLDYCMSIKSVDSFDEALLHISKYSSKHSEAIVSENRESIQRFQKLVDASSVYSNVSTAFTDGAQFGLGAEIGISTQKLHARGPMALEALTSYKWVIEGDGQIRE